MITKEPKEETKPQNIEKAEEIQRRKELGSDSDSSEMSDFEDEGEDAGAAAVMSKPSPKGDSRRKLKEKEIAYVFYLLNFFKRS